MYKHLFLDPLVHRTFNVPLVIFKIRSRQISMTLVFKWRHTNGSKVWKLLIFCELAKGGEPIQHCLCSVSISHTQKRLTADDKGMQGPGPRSKDSLKVDKLTSIPLVNVRLWLRGSGEKHVIINVKDFISIVLCFLRFCSLTKCIPALL